MKLLTQILMAVCAAVTATAAVPEYVRNEFDTNVNTAARAVVTNIARATLIASNGNFVASNRGLFSQPTRLVFDGNSRTAGLGGTDKPWPYWITNLYLTNNITSATNIGVAGQDWAATLARFQNYVVSNKPSGGTNAIYFIQDPIVNAINGDSAQQNITGMSNVLWAARTNGFYVVALTAFSVAYQNYVNQTWATPFASSVKAANSWLRTNKLTDLVIDVEHAFDSFDATTDGIHMNTNSSRLLAGYIYGKLASGTRPDNVSSKISGEFIHLVSESAGELIENVPVQQYYLSPFPGLMFQTPLGSAFWLGITNSQLELRGLGTDSGDISASRLFGLDENRGWFGVPFLFSNAVTYPLVTASRVAVFNSSKQITNSAAVDTTELEYLDGVTSAIQTQLDAKANGTGSTNLANTKQNGTAALTNLSGLVNTVFTNKPAGGTNISVRTVGGTNFFDINGTLNTIGALANAPGVVTNDGSGGMGYLPLASIGSSLPTGLVPVGCVQAWLKSFPGVPALPGSYVECNGQMLSDPESPLDGQTLPDLNGGQRFLRGASASGGTGGADTHQHDVNIGVGAAIVSLSSQDIPVANATTLPSDPASSLPSYYEVVWVMRVK